MNFWSAISSGNWASIPEFELGSFTNGGEISDFLTGNTLEILFRGGVGLWYTGSPTGGLATEAVAEGQGILG